MPPLQNKNKRARFTTLKQRLALVVVFVVVLANLLALAFFGLHGLAFLVNLVGITLAIVIYTLVRRQKNLPLLIELFPLVGKLIAFDKLINQYLDEATKLKTALEPYNLWKPPTGLDDLAKSVPADQNSAIDHFARVISEQLDPSSCDLYQQVILTLYEGIPGNSKSGRWFTRKKDIAGKMAEILLQSQKVNSGLPGFKLEKEQLTRLLLQLDEFSESAINGRVLDVAFIWERSTRYLQFLTDQSVVPLGTVAQPSVLMDLLDAQSLTLAREKPDARCFEVLISLGKTWIAQELGKGETSLLDSFVLISIAVFAIHSGEQREDWIRKACQGVAPKELAPNLVLAYLEFARESQDQRKSADGIADSAQRKFDEIHPESLKHLIRNWRRKDEELRYRLPHRGYEREINRIKTKLINGQWPEELSFHIISVFAEAEEGSPVQQIVRENPWLHPALRKVFEKVTAETIKRFLRTRTVSPYFITFSAGSWQVRDMLAELGQKYNFKQYTSSVRIGIVPKGWNFEKMCQEFQRDFDRLVSRQKKTAPGDLPADMELIVQQFEISPKNYYGFVRPGVTKEEAIERLQNLFGEILGPKELLGMIEYQGDVPVTKALLEAPIADLLISLQDLSQSEKDVIENRRAALDGILSTVWMPGREHAGVRDVAVYFLKADELEKIAVVNRVAEQLQRILKKDVASLSGSRPHDIAEDYVRTIAALVSVDPTPQAAIRK
jgi:hypothetical protein